MKLLVRQHLLRKHCCHYLADFGLVNSSAKVRELLFISVTLELNLVGHLLRQTHQIDDASKHRVKKKMKLLARDIFLFLDVVEAKHEIYGFKQ